MLFDYGDRKIWIRWLSSNWTSLYLHFFLLYSFWANSIRSFNNGQSTSNIQQSTYSRYQIKYIPRMWWKQFSQLIQNNVPKALEFVDVRLKFALLVLIEQFLVPTIQNYEWMKKKYLTKKNDKIYRENIRMP